MENLFAIIALAFFTAIFTAMFIHLIFMYHGRNLLAKLKESMDEYDEMVENDDRELVDAYIEKTETYLLLYRKDSNDFIAQGSSWEELNKNAITRYPDVMFNVTPEDIKLAKEFKA